MKNNHAKYCLSTLKNQGAKFRSQNVSPLAGTSSYYSPSVARILHSNQDKRSCTKTSIIFLFSLSDRKKCTNFSPWLFTVSVRPKYISAKPSPLLLFILLDAQLSETAVVVKRRAQPAVKGSCCDQSRAKGRTVHLSGRVGFARSRPSIATCPCLRSVPPVQPRTQRWYAHTSHIWRISFPNRDLDISGRIVEDPSWSTWSVAWSRSCFRKRSVWPIWSCCREGPVLCAWSTACLLNMCYLYANRVQHLITADVRSIWMI